MNSHSPPVRLHMPDTAVAEHPRRSLCYAAGGPPAVYQHPNEDRQYRLVRRVALCPRLLHRRRRLVTLSLI